MNSIYKKNFIFKANRLKSTLMEYAPIKVP